MRYTKSYYITFKKSCQKYSTAFHTRMMTPNQQLSPQTVARCGISWPRVTQESFWNRANINAYLFIYLLIEHELNVDKKQRQYNNV